jgi:hypothetical protein
MEDLSSEVYARVFNTPLEIGLRSLVILNSIDRKSLDPERIMFYDYLSLNTKDIGGEDSLHAPVPNRGVQVYARKDLIHKGLAIMLSKELIELHATEEGFAYTINANGVKFLEYFETEYFKLLQSRVTWVIENHGDKSNKELVAFIGANLRAWGGEFITEI